MKSNVTITIALIAALTSFTQLSIAASSQEQPSSQEQSNTQKQKATAVWDLTDLYPDIASWDAAREKTAAQIATLTECKGKLDESAEVLGQCMDKISNTYKNLLNLYVYSFLAKDTDLGNSEFRERSSMAQS
ncbi:MAG: hypothetical protein MUQ57_04835, partial [Porticoccus sp.]|nr:hypothetical protein [Porticoccus sp.]